MQNDFFGGAAQVAQSFVAYCDGACKGNPGPGGWGVRLQDIAGAMLSEAYGGARDTTNNKMELTAAIETLKRIPVGSKIEIFTDSNYVIKGISEWLPGWKRKGWRTTTGAVKNVELWKELDALYQARKVTMSWVKGHSGHPGNERADALANMGAADAIAGKA